MIEEIQKNVIRSDELGYPQEVVCWNDIILILDKYNNQEVDSKEVSDALHMLLHCSLKDTEFKTQKQQFNIVYNYISKLEEELNKYEGVDNLRKIMYKMAIRYKDLENEDIENLPSYTELLKYKNVWEELKEIVVYDDGESSETFGQMFSDDLKELEQKHNLGGVE